ncbi:MAG: CPBP family intramembrane metalloprotease, partial [Bacteroidales bacterium]|nr:CPBP family intramembrane metalloprotease [Bacteroidales bacterium]
MKKLVFTIILAAILWSIMFLPATAPHINFWWMMTASACTLSILSTLFNPGWWKGMRVSAADVFLGIGIAVALWGIFWTGDKLSQIMFNFARPQVDLIYGMKEGE